MRIGIDASYALDRHPSGVAVYSQRLIEHLARQSPQDDFFLGYRANRFFRALSAPRVGPRCRRRLLEDGWAGMFPSKLDVFHGLNQRLPQRAFGPRVATYHDLFVMSAEYSTAEFRRRFTDLAKQTAERADHVIAVSAFTAGQVTELLGFPAERVSVVHHGFDPVDEVASEELAAFRAELAGDAPIVLSVGAIQERKNTARLVQAFTRLSGDPVLVLAGAEGFGGAAIAEQIEASPAAGRMRRLGYVDAATRAKLYRLADVFAFPSLDEGFGIPVLEAMSCGLPVLTSDRSALPEVAGGAALLVDPYSVDAIETGLAGLLDDADIRARMGRAGLRRAAEFSWDRCARETYAIYQHLDR